MPNSKVSVIITTRNEEKHIVKCLNGINNQNYSPIEIIVVDNNSTDNTLELARGFTQHVYTKGPERSEQRNFGVEKSSGKYILYLDADMIISENVVGECVENCKNNPNLSGLYIPEIVIGNGFWIKVRRFERSFYDGTPIDCVRFVPKKVFEAVKGFDTSFSGPEDWDFDKKIRSSGEVKVIKAPLRHNEGKFQLSTYLSKKAYYAKSMDAYVRKWGKDDPDVIKQLGPYYRFFGVFIEKGNFIRLIKHPILTIGMYYLRFMVGLSFLRRKAT